jgi:LysR family cys regulon transcriptional activator
MNLHQFRFVQEAVRRNLNLTETAKALFTSQPGISKAILELEEELGIDLFVRHGKRLRRVTEPGQEVLKAIDVILREVANMKRIGEEYSKQDAGTLSIAATHTQARYVLPEPVAQLRRRFPKVQVSLHQGAPDQVVQMLLDGTADIGLATEALSEPDDLVSLPCYEWEHVIVMRAEHPLALVDKITLEQLAGETLISYHPSFTGRKRIDAEMAVRDDPPGGELVSRPAGYLFGRNVTRVAFRRGAYLRGYVLTFAELLSDRLTRPLLLRALGGTGENYDL